MNFRINSNLMINWLKYLNLNRIILNHDKTVLGF